MRSIRWVYDLLCVSLQSMVTLVSRDRQLVMEVVENLVSQLVGVAPVKHFANKYVVPVPKIHNF